MSISDSSASPKQWGYSRINIIKVTYNWTITEFSLRPENIKQKITSPVFHSGENKTDHWKLELYPRGDDEANKDHLSLFLKLVSTEKSEIHLQCKFSILKTSTNTKSNTKKFFRKYLPGTTLGYPCYIGRAHLMNQSHGLLTDDALVVCCEIDIPTDTISTSFVDETPPKLENPTKRRLVDDLQGLLDSSTFSDCKIIVNDKKFSTHKAILSSRSPVFTTIFSHPMTEKETSVVQIDDMRADIVKGMLQFIYTDQVPDLEKSVAEYLAAAEKYQLSGLKVKCEEIILEKVNDDNAALYLVYADRYNAIELKAKLTEFITKHLPGVVRSAGYKELEEKHSTLLGHIIRAQVNLMEEKSMLTE